MPLINFLGNMFDSLPKIRLQRLQWCLQWRATESKEHCTTYNIIGPLRQIVAVIRLEYAD